MVTASWRWGMASHKPRLRLRRRGPPLPHALSLAMIMSPGNKIEAWLLNLWSQSRTLPAQSDSERKTRMMITSRYACLWQASSPWSCTRLTSSRTQMLPIVAPESAGSSTRATLTLPKESSQSSNPLMTETFTQPWVNFLLSSVALRDRASWIGLAPSTRSRVVTHTETYGERIHFSIAPQLSLLDYETSE